MGMMVTTKGKQARRQAGIPSPSIGGGNPKKCNHWLGDACAILARPQWQCSFSQINPFRLVHPAPPPSSLLYCIIGTKYEEASTVRGSLYDIVLSTCSATLGYWALMVSRLDYWT
ncbi:hypothetical protein ACMFMF_007676 [Clarireedia jacksonii]